MCAVGETLKAVHAVIMYVRVAFCGNGLNLENWVWFQI